MLLDAPLYHAHIYFQPGEEPAIDALHDAARRATSRADGVYVVDIRPIPVGPHSRPMFEIAFTAAHREAILAWVAAHRGPFSVLIHPVTGDDLADHRDHAMWMGDPLPLDYSRL